MSSKKVIYYRDELNDEFSSAKIDAKRIDGSYCYDRTSFFSHITHFFWYRLVAMPIAFVFLKVRFGHKIVNRRVLKKADGKGYFIYGNHTQPTGDAVIPTFISFPRDAYVIVHPANVSMPYLGRVTPSMGAIPLPDTLEANRNFVKIIEKRIMQKKSVFIYPEAHIWPYYTGIRPFSEKSFHYPVKQAAPVFCFTNTYQKRPIGKHPRLVTYVDGPFYADASLTPAQAKKKLRDEVYEKMCERSKASEIAFIEYRKEANSDD